jgi:hypothetical protein
MVRPSGLAVGFVLVVVLGAVVLGPMTGETGNQAGENTTAEGTSGVVAAQQSLPQEYELKVYPNGSTRWSFVYKRTLSNRTEQRRFEAYADRFNGRRTPLYEDFVGNAETLARLGAETTGREMEARAFRRRANVTSLGNRGVIEMSFLWTNFAVVRDNGSVAIGDVFEGGDLQGAIYLGPDQQFVIRAAGELTVRSAAPDPDSTSRNAVSWTGEHEFDDGRPNALLAPPSTEEEPLPLAVGGAVLVLLGLAAAIAWRFGGLPGSEAGSGSGPGSSPAPDAGSGSSTEGTNPSGGSGEGGGGRSPEPAVAEEELLADDDRVLRLLETNGGRMRQVSIVEATDWSKSKVSMLLSEMESEGQVSRLRIGRENIVSLDGHEPDGDSPASNEE